MFITVLFLVSKYKTFCNMLCSPGHFTASRYSYRTSFYCNLLALSQNIAKTITNAIASLLTSLIRVHVLHVRYNNRNCCGKLLLAILLHFTKLASNVADGDVLFEIIKYFAAFIYRA